MAQYNLGESFRWFMARVIDNKDPERLGRVRIRIIHDQTGDLGKIVKTWGVRNTDLLWAWPISAIQSASLSWKKIVELEEYPTPDWIDAVGLSPVGIAEGTYVFGFYLDGHEQNIPLIFGTYHKRSRYPEPPTDTAADDDGNHSMIQVEPPTDTIGFYEDIAALARGNFVDPENPDNNGPGQTLPKETYQLSTLWPKSDPGKNPVDEMPTAYDAEYPYNLTYTTKSGHAIELDDTIGRERVHIWHRSGSYEEISNGPVVNNTDQDFGTKDSKYPEGPTGWTYTTAGDIVESAWTGRRVQRTTDTKFEIVQKDKNELYMRDHNIEVANTETNRIGKSLYDSVGYASPPGNRDLKDGLQYKDGGVGTGNIFEDAKENSIHTADKNYLISVNKGGPDGEYRFGDPEQGNFRMECANNSNEVIGNNHIVQIGNNQSITIANNQTVSVGANCAVSIADNCRVTIGENCTIIVGGNAKINVQGTMDVNSSGAMSISSGTSIKMNAPTIDLN